MVSGIGSNAYDPTQMMMQAMQVRRNQVPTSGELFAKADADGSGGISFEELQEANSKRPKVGGATEPSAEEAFAKMDANGDGSVSQQEHAEALEAMRQKLQQQANMNMLGRMPSEGGLFGMADADGSGGVTTDELFSALGIGKESEEAEKVAKLFDKMDANGDGEVSQAEHAAAMEAMRQKMPGQPTMGGAAAMDDTQPFWEETGSSGSESESEESYDELDTNQDGIVSQQEWNMGVEKGLVMDTDPRVKNYGSYGAYNNSTISKAA